MNAAFKIEAKPSLNTVFQPGTSLRDVERVVILNTLRSQSFNRTHTAAMLGIGIRTLQRKLKEYRADEDPIVQYLSEIR